MATLNFRPENTPGLSPADLDVLNTALARLSAQGMPARLIDHDGELTALADLVLAAFGPASTADDVCARVRAELTRIDTTPTATGGDHA